MHFLGEVVIWAVVAVLVISFLKDFLPERKVSAKGARQHRERIQAGRESGELDQWIEASARREQRRQRFWGKVEGAGLLVVVGMFLVGVAMCGYAVLYLFSVVD